MKKHILNLRGNRTTSRFIHSDSADSLSGGNEPVGSLTRENCLPDADGESGVVGVLRKSNILNIIAIALTTLTVGSFVFIPSTAFAQDANKEAVCDAIGMGTGCESSDTTGVNSVISTGLSIFSTIIGLAAVVMILVAGYKYITSSGDSSKVASAKSTLIYAIVGIIVAALAQVVVKYVLSKAK